MSRAQTIRFALQVVGAVAGILLFMQLPDEIRADLEARKDAP